MAGPPQKGGCGHVSAIIALGQDARIDEVQSASSFSKKMASCDVQV